jgi:hypothetical protein
LFAAGNSPVTGKCGNGSTSGQTGNPEEGTPTCISGTVNISSYLSSGNCQSWQFSCAGSYGGASQSCGYVEWHCQ